MTARLAPLGCWFESSSGSQILRSRRKDHLNPIRISKKTEATCLLFYNNIICHYLLQLRLVGKMDEFVKNVFLLELKRQVYFADKASKQIDLAIQMFEAPISQPPDTEILLAIESDVFRNIHSFLSHASNVSKILWPSKKANSERGDELRKELGLSPDNVLKKRALRDHLEHFDERMDAWAQQSKEQPFITCIGHEYLLSKHEKNM